MLSLRYKRKLLLYAQPTPQGFTNHITMRGGVAQPYTLGSHGSLVDPVLVGTHAISFSLAWAPYGRLKRSVGRHDSPRNAGTPPALLIP